MRLIKKLSTGWLLFACAASFNSYAMPSARKADMDAVVKNAAEDAMRQHGIPGLAIAIAAGGEQWFYSYGVASKKTEQKITEDTIFEIGSVSKTFTATLATYAQAKGQLSLTDSPGKYLPQLRGTSLDKVTLVNLGTHTAGGFPLQVPDAIGNTGQLMDYFKAWQPAHVAGTERSYANPSIGMLGMVVAKSMQMPFEEAMEQQLFRRLGMFDSFINVPAGKMPLYAQGYNRNDEPVRLNPGVLAAEAYGVKTSAKDLIRFVEANMGLISLEEKLQRAITGTHTGYYKLGAMTQDLIWEQYSYPATLNALLEGNSAKMALESHAVVELKPPQPPQKEVWINKTGSTNGFGAYVAFVPAKKIGIVVLANKNYPNESRVRLAHQILEQLDCCARARQ